MMHALEIIASSWPLAVVFSGFCATCIALYITRSLRKATTEDRIFSASQARDVTRRDN